nr:MAG TPA: hypothetical protein [Caudoviricetes sp.]
MGSLSSLTLWNLFFYFSFLKKYIVIPCKSFYFACLGLFLVIILEII